MNDCIYGGVLTTNHNSLCQFQLKMQHITHTERHSSYDLILFLGLVGLAISYALSITWKLSAFITSFTDTEKQMVSVERVLEYVNETPKEDEGTLLVIYILTFLYINYFSARHCN